MTATRKPKCPECKGEMTLLLDEDDFNTLYEMVSILNERVTELEKRGGNNDKKNKNKN